MTSNKHHTFSAPIELIGINPFVFVSESILQALFVASKKDKGAIPIKGTINGKDFRQTLVKYKGEWRLYINTIMLKNSPKRIGEIIEIAVAFDPEDRTLPPPPKFVEALNQHTKAKETFEQLPPHLQKEIIRYLSSLKRESSLIDNIAKAIGFLEGKNRFVGREPIKHD